MASFYVTGTDTEIGKTRVSCALLRTFCAAGKQTIGMKPVASGCDSTAEGLRNDDALQLIDASSSSPDYADVNPYAFANPIAPHLAAQDQGSLIELDTIQCAYARLRSLADVIVVEGVGGWCAPLGSALMQADLVKALQLPVVLVVGLRLGCLNHALLSARAIEADGCRLLGWIGNRIDPDMLRCADNIETLRSRIEAPLLGILDHGSTTLVWQSETTLHDLLTQGTRSP